MIDLTAKSSELLDGDPWEAVKSMVAHYERLWPGWYSAYCVAPPKYRVRLLDFIARLTVESSSRTKDE